MFKQLQSLSCRWTLIAFLLTSFTAYADFDYSGQGTLIDENGQSKNFEFGFSYIQHNGEYRFKAGKMSMLVDEVPKRYTLELIQNSKQQVWISDFSKTPLLGFHWHIGNHQLQLTKEPETSRRAGQFKLTINQTEYFFTSKNRGQIHFKFTDKGIAEIDVGSMMTQKR